ncbi:MMPL family transporter [Saccharothrix syringae]|uniref:MMPL family transporter n=1 Tax=Saccharothrix syringae TaxID=103733 RepID=A0A5Q0H3F4_SACSY|nr:MMPL family transporter [Saccharothrix syringae]
MARLLYRLGVGSARRPLLVITAWLLLAAGLAAAAIGGMRFADGGFEIDDTESSTALEVVEREFPSPSGEPGTGTLQLVLFTEDGTPLDEAQRTTVADVLVRAAATGHVAEVSDPFDPARPAVSSDGTTAIATLSLREITEDNRDAVHDAVVAVAEQARDRGLGAEVGGSIGDPMPEVFGPTEVVGAVLAFAVLLLTYGSLAAAGANMLGALIGVAVGVLGVLAFSAFSPIGSMTPTLAVMLGLAVGIDYCLFVLARFRAELREGRPLEDAIGRATGTAGSAVVFAGGTVVIALAGLAVVGIGFITEMGLAAAVGVAVAVLMSLTLLPAALKLMGRRALPRRERAGGTPVRADRIGFLDRWIKLVVRRPVTVLAGAVAGLLVLAVPVLSLATSLTTPGGEDPDSTQRAAYEQIADAFGAGYQGPLIVLAQGDGVQARLDEVTSRLTALGGVASVAPAGVNATGDTALLQVVPTTGPVDERTERLVHDIRDRADDVPGVDLLVTGQTAIGIDTDERLSAALVTYLVVIVGLSLLLLVVVFRSLLVPLIATVGFLLSLGAGVGVTVAVFQWGWLGPVFSAPQGNPMLSLLPVLIVGILFGLAMDYQVFLVSRMHEAHVRGLDPVEAVMDGFGRTAVVVVSAATIMTAVFAGFALSPSSLIGSIGLALTAGVVADAFVVRMIVVPALLTLLGRRAWWLPGWLDRVLPHLDAEGRALDEPSPTQLGHQVDDQLRPPVPVAAGSAAQQAAQSGQLEVADPPHQGPAAP